MVLDTFYAKLYAMSVDFPKSHTEGGSRSLHEPIRERDLPDLIAEEVPLRAPFPPKISERKIGDFVVLQSRHLSCDDNLPDIIIRGRHNSAHKRSSQSTYTKCVLSQKRRPRPCLPNWQAIRAPPSRTSSLPSRMATAMSSAWCATGCTTFSCRSRTLRRRELETSSCRLAYV
jgi:hypothetical protein